MRQLMSNVIHMLPTHFEKDVRKCEVDKRIPREIKALDGLPLQLADIITIDRVSSTVLELTRAGAIRRIGDEFFYVRDPYSVGMHSLAISPDTLVTL